MLSVKFASMSDSDDRNHFRLVVDLITDAIIAYTNPPDVAGCADFDAAAWSWLCHESINRRRNIGCFLACRTFR
jgi:hypothetical protein